MSIDWLHAGAPALAAFLASLVEFVEALTVILAVGVVRSWRGAVGGAALALALLVVMVAAIGPALQRVPLDLAKLAIGCLLVLFGLRWLRKAMLRAAGVIPLHDEQAAYDGKTRMLRGLGPAARSWDKVAIAAAFQITMIEGLEVVFIVIAIGAGGPGLLPWASAGALAALVLTISAGAALHRPLTAVPENTLKFAVGVLLSAFGTFWVGEGSGLAWPGGDVALPMLAGGFLGVALLGVRTLRRANVSFRPKHHIP
jgi:uncharacterized membrane protein